MCSKRPLITFYRAEDDATVTREGEHHRLCLPLIAGDLAISTRIQRGKFIYREVASA